MLLRRHPPSLGRLVLPWSTWSAVINLTSRAGELRSAPSKPDDRYRVVGKRALALGGARSQGHNTGLRGLAPCTGFGGFPLNCRTHPLLGAKEYSPRAGSVYQVSP